MTNTAHLILTVDYEVFGNGSGNVDCCIIAPAKKILDTADCFDAPITLFVEALEIIAFENDTRTSPAADAIKKQIQGAVSCGHDAQLHLHPQWSQAEYDETRGWTVDVTRWRTGDLRKEEINQFVRNGKIWLENLVKEVKPEYSCTSFRAGGWCIQPSDQVLDVLAAADFEIDSTVAPGMKRAAKREWSDFRFTPQKPFWMTSSNVCKENQKGKIAEVPITTAKISPFKHFSAKRVHQGQANGGLAPACSGSYGEPNGVFEKIIEKAGKLLQLRNAMLDFSTMPADVLIEITEKWLKAFDNIEIPIPIVAIAHTKNFTESSAAAMQTYLEWACTQNIKFSTYSDWYGDAVGQ